MAMELSQLTQMTTWLDEEHRRDKAELIKVQQRLESHEGHLTDQSRLIQDLEGRVASLQAQLLRFGQLETAIQQLKDEVVLMLQQFEERHQSETRESDRVRAIERDNVSKAVNEIRRDLQRLPRLEEELGLRKAEQRRLSEMVLALQQDVATVGKESEDRVRSLPFLEEGRQQDAKRIARLQQESLEALKRTEQLASRLTALEDVPPRQERNLSELKEVVSQVRSTQREFIDGQLLQMEQLKRQMTEWSQMLTSETQKVDGFGTRLQEFGESFQNDRRVVEAVERFQERISREQTQVSELQRLAEERQMRQLEQWQEENEKRWKKELLGWEHHWGEQAKRNKDTVDRFAGLEKVLAQHQIQIGATWKFLEAQIAFDIQEDRRRQNEMSRLLEERPKQE
jgi:hypothetical protein